MILNDYVILLSQKVEAFSGYLFEAEKCACSGQYQSHGTPMSLAFVSPKQNSSIFRMFPHLLPIILYILKYMNQLLVFSKWTISIKHFLKPIQDNWYYVCSELNSVSFQIYIHLEMKNVTLFGNRDFIDVIKIRIHRLAWV